MRSLKKGFCLNLNMINAQKNSLLPILLFFFSATVWSQLFDKTLMKINASDLYYQGVYPNVDQAFSLLEDFNTDDSDQEEINYFKMVTALRLNDPGAVKRIETFRLDYPNTVILKTVYLDLANYYFNNEKYSYAHKWFAKVKSADVPKPSLPQFYFNKGYTLFAKKQYSKAKALLENVKFDPKYESDAHYYLGHIAYQLEDYAAASNSFTKVSKKKQQENLGYFQVEMNFKLGRFEKAIALGESEIHKVRGENFSELSKIIGESYFNTQQYEKALKHLKNYKGKNGKWTHTDFYQLGYAYYETENYSQAIDQFSKIIGKKDKLAQNAYYYLAECYLKKDRKPSAFNAYRSAASMDFNPDITQIALLNYAKLSYEIGNPYEKVPVVIIRYLETYPKSEDDQELTALLLSSYTNSGDYDGVIKILSSQNDYKDDHLLQRVTYLKGIQLFNAGDYSQSKDYFLRAVKYDKTKIISAHSLFWLAQSYYELNRFEDAVDAFHDFENKLQKKSILNSLEYHYHLGYAYFKMTNHELALSSFQKVIDHKNHYASSKIRDAYLRMGDCEFVLNRFWPAMEQYNKSIDMSPAQSDYALYQKSISYGFVDRNPQKIKTLQELIEKHSNSVYGDDAFFELSSAYAVAGSFDTAIDTYDKMISRYPKSPYLPKAILNKGLILYNQEKLSQAETVLKKLIIRFNKNAVAQQALLTLKEIAIDLDKVADFTQWLRKMNIDTFSDNELEKTAFSAAEKQFLTQRKKQAKKSFISYLESYPDGLNALNAHFTLAEIYYEESDTEAALVHYQKLIDEAPNEYLEQALVRVTQIWVNQEMEGKAAPLWKQLENVAVYPENKRYAMFNLMRFHFQAQDMLSAQQKATTVLTLKNIEVKVKWDAYKILAKSSLALRDSIKAQEAFKVLEKAPIEALAAEAYYFRAHQNFQNNDFEKSNEVIAVLSQKFSSQPYWAAKSLLLMAKNFYALKDAFQATYILQSLVDNYNQFPEISKEGQTLLEQINQEQAEQNASLSSKKINP
jgi:tetratricopeptide (TPR) repeat protein